MWLVNTVLLLRLNFGLSRGKYTLLNSSTIVLAFNGLGEIFVQFHCLGFTPLGRKEGVLGVCAAVIHICIFYCSRVEHQCLCSRGTGVALVGSLGYVSLDPG